MDTFGLFRAWWTDIGPRKGESTARQYRYYVLRTRADLPRDPREMTAAELTRHLEQLTPAMAKAVRAALNDFFGWMTRAGWRLDNPLEKAKRAKSGKRRVKRGWTEEELFRVWNAAIWIGSRGRRGTGQPLAWAILAQYALGLRPGELIDLTWERVNLNGSSSCVYVTETKTGNDRIVPVEGIGRVALDALRALSPNHKVVHVGRTQYWAKVRAAAQLAGLAEEKCRPYALRHTFATRLIEKGVHTRIVGELLGHVDPRAVYGYTVPGDDALREAVRRLG
jgi:integrase